MDLNTKTKAEKLIKIANGNICNHCLGRKFSDYINASNNEERGKIIRSNLNIENYNLSEKASNQICKICKNLLIEINAPKYKEYILKKVEDKINYLELEYDSFLIGSKISKNILENDEKINELIQIKESETIKKDINRSIGEYLEKNLKKEVNFENPDVVFLIDLRNLILNNQEKSDSLENSYFDEVKVRIQINPIFIEGKYLKLVRGIPQTKWPCRKCKGRGCESCNFTGKMYQESVEELISHVVLKEAKGYASKFHGAGREDIDVKMLGSGRPFVLEIKEPKKRNLDLKNLRKKVNEHCKGKTEYRDLKFTAKARKAEIKVSSPETFKIYRALIECEDEVSKDELAKLQSLNIISQQTPKRVSHRRSDKIRKKEVKELSTKLINSKSFEMIIKTQGGLYIKELISGDDNRTKPSVSDLLGLKSTCKKLDVIEVSSEK
ncbi:MAG: tRNA pseudouridine(54/55) synthase Pus10 [Methanobacteriaceae archaeon]|jgi:tRNA pseudouridine synthase 10|nr:tRNA pseudouridine(54/55) synthase Pus10 [Candidatus Methanorudis spinitermitis]